jgi:hypothetical protein
MKEVCAMHYIAHCKYLINMCLSLKDTKKPF